MHRRTCIASLAVLLATGASVGPLLAASRADFTFASIDGGELSLDAFRGGPLLVVNTASRCAFTSQYDALQALYDRFRDRGLTVLGVPSNSFRQELASTREVKEFCEVNFALDFPMTGLAEVVGPGAHPFYRWAAAAGVAPRWNFHKILLDGEGRLAAEFGTPVTPDAPELIAAIEALLPQS